MKKVFVSLMLLMCSGIGNAQFTELKEARVGFDPQLPEMTVDGDKYIFNVKQKYEGEFEKDPIAFLEKYCEIEAFIDLVQDEKTIAYQVEVNSNKGRMKAKYCKEGNLIRVSYKLKNVQLPASLQADLYRNYKGWNMTRNIHFARSRNGNMRQEYYKIRLEKAGEVQNLKIEVNDPEPIEVASR